MPLTTLRAEQLKRLALKVTAAPLVSGFVLPSDAAQFIYGFGPELYLSGLITGVLAFLATQLNGVREKKELALESLTLLSVGLTGLYIMYAVQLFGAFSGLFFHGYFLVSTYTIAMKLLTVYSVHFILTRSRDYIVRHTRSLLEYPLIMVLALLFMLLLVGSSHLISGFLSLVGFSLNLYVLILFDAKAAVAREAGVKYFYLSTLSSGLMLYGIFLMFLVLGTGQFQEIGQFLMEPELDQSVVNLLRPAIMFLLVGLFFKLSAFPGHL